MSQRREGPQNRVELSSVSVVRLKRKGASFEVAAYPNEVRDFRAGVEGDVDEVLQVVSVFSNTVHGVVAPKKQLQKAFPGLSVAQICEEILRRGQLQVSAKEREAETDKLMAEVTNLVASMVVDAQTGSRLAPDAVGRLLPPQCARLRGGQRAAVCRSFFLLNQSFGFMPAAGWIPMRHIRSRSAV